MSERGRSAGYTEAVREHQTPVISAHSAGFTACVRQDALAKPRAKELLTTTLQARSSPLNFLCNCCEPNCRLFLPVLPAFAFDLDQRE